MPQSELWEQVLNIVGRVRQQVSSDPSPALRASQVYRNYAGVCVEALMAHEEAEFDEEIVKAGADSGRS